MASGDKTADVSGSIIRIAKEPKTAPKGGYLFRGIEISAGSQHERTFVICPVFSGSRMYEFPLLCHEGLMFAGFNLQYNNRLDDGSIIYTATRKSDLILEPFRLVSVTEAVEAAGCTRSADVRFRVGPEEPLWMAKGKLIHSLMEHIFRSRCRNVGPDFFQAFQTALPAFASILPGSSISADPESLQQEARNHFDNLTHWLDEHHAGSRSVETEADRMSVRWGLKGRADAIIYHAGHRTVLELKTGRAASNQHLLQLYAYSLLMNGGGDALPTEGCVFYSATGGTGLMGVMDEDARHAIVDGRNRVVALKHSYTLGADSSSSQLPEVSCNGPERCFSRRNCLRLFGGAAGTGGFLRGGSLEYYDRWFRLLSIEDWAAEGNFSRILDPDTLSERLNDGATLAAEMVRFNSHRQLEEPQAPGAENQPHHGTDLGCDDYQPAGPGTTLANKPLALLSIPLAAETDLQPGEEVILHSGDPCGEDSLRGRVFRVEKGLAAVSLKVPLSCSGASVASHMPPFPSRNLFLDRIPFSRARLVARHALFRFFLRADPQVVQAVVGSGGMDEPDKRPGPPEGNAASRTARAECQSSGKLDDLCYSEGLSAELNEDQTAAVKAAIDCEVFHLIHGPPGTGKTRLLARLIRLCLDRGERVLVACPTNIALDRILVAAVHLGVKRLLRIGSRSNVSDEFLEVLEGIGNPPALLEDFTLNVSDFGAFTRTVNALKLVGATAYQCASHPFFLRQRFDRVILDEAGQLDEPLTLAPLALAPRFVLCGDHLQLPPVVQTRTDSEASAGEPGLEQSLFERLYQSSPSTKISRLRVQYRMNEEVQAIPSKLFYDGALFPSPENARRRLLVQPGVSCEPHINRIIDPEHPVIFVDIEGNSSGKASPREAQVACRIVESLLGCGVPAGEIGIITPYRAQQALIRACLSGKGIRQRLISVDTVDRFQGGEREVILLSLARSDGVTSFLADEKRLNVSLSRARSKLILLGHAPTLGGHPLFQSLLKCLDRVVMSSE